MMTWWEPGNLRIVAYLCYASSLPRMKSRKRKIVAGSAQMALFATTEALVEQNAVITGERVDYVLRLPYTQQALENRQVMGRDVPDWFTGD